MGRLLPFAAGCALSGLQILNYTYNSELQRATIKEEVETLKRMSTFELDDVAKFRNADHSQRAVIARVGKTDPSLDTLETHYHYFWNCHMNALKESMFGFSPAATLRKIKSALSSVNSPSNEDKSD